MRKAWILFARDRLAPQALSCVQAPIRRLLPCCRPAWAGCAQFSVRWGLGVIGPFAQLLVMVATKHGTGIFLCILLMEERNASPSMTPEGATSVRAS